VLTERDRAASVGGLLYFVGGQNYFSDVLTAENVPLRLVPRPFTTAMIASAIPAAIRPYSIAVAPVSSDKKFNKVRFNSGSRLMFRRTRTFKADNLKLN
jgi:hypothetical protein